MKVIIWSSNKSFSKPKSSINFSPDNCCIVFKVLAALGTEIQMLALSKLPHIPTPPVAR